jgi:phosphoribosylglycinamide formyltransferase-1
VIIQARVPVLDGDDADTLAARVLEQEHIVYPRAIKWFAQGRLAVDKGIVLLDGVPSLDIDS